MADEPFDYIGLPFNDTASVNTLVRIQRDVTTYRKNAYGVADNSYLDSETLHTSAYVLRKLKSVITSKYGRHKLASDGTRFGPGQAIVTPAVIKGNCWQPTVSLSVRGSWKTTNCLSSTWLLSVMPAIRTA